MNSIVTKFFQAAQTNEFLFAAVLFWKSRQDCVLLGSKDGDNDDEEDDVEEAANDYDKEFVVDDEEYV